MKFRRAHELGVAASIGAFGEALNRDAEHPLTQEHDEVLELFITEVLVSVLHVKRLSCATEKHPQCRGAT